MASGHPNRGNLAIYQGQLDEQPLRSCRESLGQLLLSWAMEARSRRLLKVAPETEGLGRASDSELVIGDRARRAAVPRPPASVKGALRASAALRFSLALRAPLDPGSGRGREQVWKRRMGVASGWKRSFVPLGAEGRESPQVRASMRPAILMTGKTAPRSATR